MKPISELAAQIGALSWVAAELFALEGRWAAGMQEPGAVEHLAVHSRHHGWHAGLWRDALPDSVSLDATRHVTAPPGWAAAIAAVDDLGSSDVARLAVLYRGLVPRLAAMLDDLDRALVGPGDAHLRRVAGLVRPDVTADLWGGTRHLVATLRDDEAVETATSTTKTLDQAFRPC